jgi:hypothetical protein
MDADREAQLAAGNLFRGFEQTTRVVVLYPLLHEGIRHLDFKCIALTAQAKPNTVPEPELVPGASQPL